jgi:hypothetical protein
MQTKTAVKVISLYDFFVKNKFLIISTFYHVFILMFNYYAIKDFERLKIEFSDYNQKFDIIETNLEFCQAITLFTAVIIFFTKDIPTIFTTDGLKVFIMSSSCSIKMIYALIQVINNKNLNLFSSSQDEINKFGGFYIINELSYNIRFVIFIIPPFALLLFLAIIMEKTCIKIKEWSKTFNIRYVEYSEVPKLEDV